MGLPSHLEPPTFEFGATSHYLQQCRFRSADGTTTPSRSVQDVFKAWLGLSRRYCKAGSLNCYMPVHSIASGTTSDPAVVGMSPIPVSEENIHYRNYSIAVTMSIAGSKHLTSTEVNSPLCAYLSLCMTAHEMEDGGWTLISRVTYQRGRDKNARWIIDCSAEIQSSIV